MNSLEKDFFFAALAGVLTAFFLLPTFKNIGLKPLTFFPAAVLGIPLLWLAGLVTARFLGRKTFVIYQFTKFVVVGFLNTAIDFGVLNSLSLLTGLTKGFVIGGINVPGFILAATNSYFWNKFWVFSRERKKEEKIDYSDFFSFFVVVFSGALINGGVVIFITTFLVPLFGASAGQWLNLAKAGATVVSLVWNFLGFKFFVFRK